LIDDNRLVDRAAAVRSGVGWTGRSMMTLVPGVGPWVLLGSVVTDAPLTISAPMRRGCGVCTACIPACPTAALGDWGLDARRCLSTWLQTPGSLPHWIRPRLGRRIYGCDDCLEACPPGHRALADAGEPGSLPFPALLELGDEALLERFDWWYVPRRDGRYLRRNLLVAAGNSGEPEARGSIENHMRHPSSMIRSHAAWALARSLGPAAAPVLREALETETAPETGEELRLAGLMVERPEAHRELLAADEWARGQSAVRSLALVGHDPDMELLLVGAGDRLEAPPESGGHRELKTIALSVEDLFDRTARVEDLIRVYDPDQILGRWRTELRLTPSLQV
jgi:ferredoxin